ncbi:MAG: Divergent family protein [Haloplasmataceae bacterium]|jgi:acid phosphatase family membrane protein YuiD|nr:Divergent family protein [Haloplasmataceae bacterium]
MFFNFPLFVAVIAMLIAQLIKLPLNYLINKEFTPSIVLSTGGMPSSHSAFVTSLVIAVGMVEGVKSTYFAIAFVMAGVVIHDAMGIRREAGKHATVLNKMGEDFKYLFNAVSKKEYDKETYDKKFKELLGHEPSEAVGGILLGISIAIICFLVYKF